MVPSNTTSSMLREDDDEGKYLNVIDKEESKMSRLRLV